MSVAISVIIGYHLLAQADQVVLGRLLCCVNKVLLVLALAGENLKKEEDGTHSSLSNKVLGNPSTIPFQSLGILVLNNGV